MSVLSAARRSCIPGAGASDYRGFFLRSFWLALYSLRAFWKKPGAGQESLGVRKTPVGVPQTRVLNKSAFKHQRPFTKWAVPAARIFDAG